MISLFTANIKLPFSTVVQLYVMLSACIMEGLSVAGAIIPSVGIGLLMLMMIKKGELWTFLIAGFTLAVYLGLSVLPITLIALPIALIYDLATQQKVVVQSSANKLDEDDEEDYDLFVTKQTKLLKMT
mgnify:CR=1 FL=1